MEEISTHWNLLYRCVFDSSILFSFVQISFKYYKHWPEAGKITHILPWFYLKLKVAILIGFLFKGPFETYLNKICYKNGCERTCFKIKKQSRYFLILLDWTLQ